MAAEIQTGTGIVYGIANSGSTISFGGYATFILDTAGAAHNFAIDEVKDELKYDKSLIATNGNVEVDLNWTPSGATRAAASTTAVFLTPLTKVVLANFKVTAFNGDWVYIGGAKIDLSQGPGKMAIKVRKYDDSSQNSSLTTTVSG